MGTNTILRLRSRWSLLGISPVNNPSPGAAACLRPGTICSHEMLGLSRVPPERRNAHDIHPKRARRRKTTPLFCTRSLKLLRNLLGCRPFPTLLKGSTSRPLFDHYHFKPASCRQVENLRGSAEDCTVSAVFATCCRFSPALPLRMLGVWKQGQKRPQVPEGRAANSWLGV